MKPEAYQTLANRQETYWWHRARRALALALLRRYGLATGCAWLDVGCGPGGNFSMLDPLEPSVVAGVDASPIALSLASAYSPSAVLERADVNDGLPFSDGSFDVVTIFNVLYHRWVHSEAHVLADVARVLRPGGLLLLTEPAFNALKREMDEAVMTRRRYRSADFDPWLRDAGFESLFTSYFTSFGVPILLGAKLVRRGSRNGTATGPGLDMQPLPDLVNQLFAVAAKIEGWALAKGVSVPFGTTLIRVARKRMKSPRSYADRSKAEVVRDAPRSDRR